MTEGVVTVLVLKCSRARCGGEVVYRFPVDVAAPTAPRRCSRCALPHVLDVRPATAAEVAP